MLEEEWKHLEDYPGYSVSTYGRVLNDRRGLILAQRPNQQGIACASLIYRGNKTSASVARLVAGAFVPRTNPHFLSPINLNGHRMDNHVDNLMWRPRWFAYKYHQQFNVPDFYYVPRATILLLDTEEEFEGLVEPSTKYGLHYKDIMYSYMIGSEVFPTKQKFRLL